MRQRAISSLFEALKDCSGLLGNRKLAINVKITSMPVKTMLIEKANVKFDFRITCIWFISEIGNPKKIFFADVKSDNNVISW